jgi:hypothetical protein
LVLIPTPSLQLHGTPRSEPDRTARTDGRTSRSRHVPAHDGRARQIMDIFEGTEQIQQLVIARAVSGLRIE